MINLKKSDKVTAIAVLQGLCATLLMAISAAAAVGGVTPLELRCEYRVNPLGIDEPKPRLTWQVDSVERGQKQTAYRILVASTTTGLQSGKGDLWDSGKVASSQTVHVVYDGKPMPSRQRCYWKVRVWDRDGKPSEWSQSASWSMGLLDDSDWSARYISYRDETPVFSDPNSLFLPAARQYRKEFTAKKKVRRATLYATALGIYELELNGNRVGDEYFAPGWTDYRLRAYYNTYDVLHLLNEGENAMGALVADGWYSGYVGFGLLVGIGTEKTGRYMYGKTPSWMAQLELEYEDGSRVIIGTDKSWKVTGDGPIRQADLQMGELYDARKEMPGWSEPGFGHEEWEEAIFAEENSAQHATFYETQNPSDSGQKPEVVERDINLGFARPKLEAFPGVAVKLMEEIKPVKITRLGGGKYIFDLGQNFAGTVRLKASGPEGHRITLRFGEMLHPDGRLMTENLRKARATDFYVCKGAGDVEVFSPRFTYHGFQYVEVSNFMGDPGFETITGLVLHSDTPMSSSFECSDPTVNQLYRNVIWTQRANFLDLPTDCPQRDERMGWTGDAQIYIGTAMYNADVGAFYTKWFRELMDSQRPSGVFPGYAPYPYRRGWEFGTAWADAGVICPWTLWRGYGDTRILVRCWEPMTRFMDWRKQTSRNNLGVNHGNDWGDWVAQGEKTPLDFIDTIYFAISSSMMAEMAAAIDRPQERKKYRNQFEKIKAAFVEKYLKSDGGITVHTQTAHALALFADLLPEEMRAATGQRLADMIAVNGNHMATGFLGTRALLPVLSSIDQHDLATFLLQSHEFPSWGYEIDQGATTIWERWDSYTKEDGFGRHNAEMNSFSHYSFGAVCEWMFHTLAGIRTETPGYSEIIIHPMPPAPGSNAQHDPIQWVRASYDSIRGKIATDWRVEGDRFSLDVTIPTNTSATVFIPAAGAEDITESGKELSKVDGVRFVDVRNGQAVLAVESGSYQFESTHAIPSARMVLKTSKRPAVSDEKK